MDSKKMTSNCHLGSSKTKFNNYKKSFQINDIFPDDVIKLGECVGQISVNKFEPKNIDEYEEILVVEVFSPSHFYIHQKNNILEFYDMMEALHNFYEQYKLHYIIPKIALQPGLHVAVKYFDKWHRGIIKNVNDYSQIEVLYFDYGTLGRQQSNELFFLQSKFGQMPGQAIQCGLFNIRPVKTEGWSLQTRQHFFRKIINRLLVGVVGSIIEKNNSLMIGLIDTSQDEDIHLCDWLVEKYDAEYRTTSSYHHNFLYEYDLECKGVRPSNKEPIIPLSAFNDYNNSHSNKKISNNDLSSCCHRCPKCGYEFNDKKLDKGKMITSHKINLIEKKSLKNGDDKLVSRDHNYDSEQGLVQNKVASTGSNESSIDSGAIDWARLKDTSDEKDNDKKYGIAKMKMLTSTDILKDIVKTKKSVEVVDPLCKQYLNQDDSHGFDVIKEYVDVGRSEVTSMLKKITTIAQDLPMYDDMVFTLNVQHNGEHVTTSFDTSDEVLIADIDDKNNEEIITSNGNDIKRVIIDIADVDPHDNDNDKLNFVDEITPTKKKGRVDYDKGIWQKKNYSSGSTELDSDDLSSEEDLNN